MRDNLNYLKDLHDGAQYQNWTPTRGSGDAEPVYLLLRKARGSLGSPTIVSSGDNLGALHFNGYDGSTYAEAAKVVGMVDGTPGASDMPGRLVFYTTADGSASATERMRISAAGQIIITDAAASAAAPALALHTGDLDTGIYRSAADTIAFAAGGVQRATISSDGVTADSFVILGDTNTLIESGGVDRLNFVMGGSSLIYMAASVSLYGQTTPWLYTDGAALAVIIAGSVPMTIDRQTNDGTLISLRQGGTEEGSISVSGTTVAYNTFTGAHFTQLKANQEEPPQGAVVVTTGEIVQSDNVHYIEDVVEEAPEAARAARATTVREVRHDRREGPGSSAWREVRGETKDYLPHIAGTTTEGDPAVYGVWIGQVREDAAGGSFGKNGRPVYNVAGVGTYEVRVTDSGGDIAPGALLCSSKRKWEAQKQADDVVRAGTLGKALTGVKWDDVPMDRALGYRWRLVSVALYCG